MIFHFVEKREITIDTSSHEYVCETSHLMYEHKDDFTHIIVEVILGSAAMDSFSIVKATYLGMNITAALRKANRAHDHENLTSVCDAILAIYEKEKKNAFSLS